MTQPDDSQTAFAASTGNDEVDAIVAALEPLGEMPVADHVAVFEQLHGQLRGVLARPPVE